MQILHLVSYSLFSGPLPPTLGLAEAQRRLGHRVFLACDSLRGNFDGYEEAAAPHIAAAGLQPGVPLHLSTKAQLWQTLFDLRHLQRFVRSRAIDVVHCHTSHDHTLMAVLRPRATVIRTAHNAHLWRRRLLQRGLLARCAGLVVRSRAHQALMGLRFGVEADKVRSIAASIDSHRFTATTAEASRRAWRERWGVPPQAPLLGHVALLARRGQEPLLEALLLVPELHVVFVGDGARRAALQKKALRLGLADRVHFAGYVAYAELPALYQALDAAYVAQPGKDGGARAALEAMASGVPLFAVQQGALAELCDEQRGAPLAAADPACLVAALRAWLMHPAQARQRAAVARAYVQHERQFIHEAKLTLDFYEARKAQPRALSA